MNVINLGDTFNDFSDTAAAMENLDIFISSDNSVINLAGAMGKTSIILLHLDCEWRWFLEEETNPWYDSMRIFKQKQFDNWDEVFDRLVPYLKNNFNLH
jgi:ADP-heptose:LPS heptosyltransferase